MDQPPATDLEELRRGAAPFVAHSERIRSADFLKALIAWRHQEQDHRMPTALARELDRLGAAFERDADYIPAGTPLLKHGTTLSRMWQGRRHTVMVLREGFAYGDDVFVSLSEVARHITGARWNGPRFFGLRVPGKKSAPAASGQP